MVRVEDALVARYETKGHKFEILVDQKLVDLIKSGKNVDVREYMAIDTIFKDHAKGDKASEESIREAFGTTDINEVVKDIIKKGQVQLTTEQRRKMTEERKRQIIEIIARESLNPQTGAPHPPHRIEKAMEEAKVRVDPFKTAEEQIQDVLKAIKVILPIRFEHVKLQIKITGSDYGKLYSELTRMGEIKSENWGNDGSYTMVLEIPAGIQDQVFEVVNKRTKGNSEIKILK